MNSLLVRTGPARVPVAGWIVALLLAGPWEPVGAQLVMNEVVAVGPSSASVALLDLGGVERSVEVTPTPLPGTPRCITRDGSRPNSFFVGGDGFIGRVTLSGPAAGYSEAVATFGGVALQMSLDLSGFLAVIDSVSDRVWALDPSTGSLSPVTVSMAAWGIDLSAGAVQPSSGDIVAGGDGMVFTVPFGSPVPLPLAGPFGGPGVPSPVSSVAFDPFSDDIILAVQGVDRILRVVPSGSVVDLVPPGTITNPTSVDADAAGDFVISNGSGDVFWISNGGTGGATLLGTLANLGGCYGLASVQDTALGLRVSRPTAGEVTLEVLGLPATTTEGWCAYSLATSQPLGSGSLFGVVIDTTILGLLFQYPVATPGNPFHWTYPSPGLFPEVPLTLPVGVLPTGLPLDIVCIARIPTGAVSAPPSRFIP